jgi:hypothetical protein
VRKFILKPAARRRRWEAPRARTGRRLIPVIVVAVLLSGWPNAAFAACPPGCSSNTWASALYAKWAEKKAKIAEWMKQANNVLNVTSAFSGTFDKFRDDSDKQWSRVTAVQHAGSAVQGSTLMNLSKNQNGVIIDSKINGIVAGKTAKIAASPNDTTLCNTIITLQGAVITYSFALAVENALTASMEALGLGPNADFNGPQYGGFANQLSCPPTDPNDPRHNDPKTGISQNNPSADCLETTDSQLDENFEAQRSFMAAWKYCIRAMGPRPTPPSGAAILTPEGISITAGWNHCASAQSVFIRQCAKMVAKHTRPNCVEAQYKQMCADSMAACEAAAALGANLPFSCKQAMTKYQSELAARLACFGRAKLKWGSTERGEALKEQNECDAAYKRWQKQQAKEQQNFISAMGSLNKIKACWPHKTTVSPVIKDGASGGGVPTATSSSAASAATSGTSAGGATGGSVYEGADISARIVSGEGFVLELPPLGEFTYTTADGKIVKVKIPVPTANPSGHGVEPSMLFIPTGPDTTNANSNTGASPATNTMPKDSYTPDEQKILDIIDKWKNANVPYVPGGTTLNGADCSGAPVGIIREYGIPVDHFTTSTIKDSPWFDRVDGGVAAIQPGNIYIVNWAGDHMVMVAPNGSVVAGHTYGVPFGDANIANTTKYEGYAPTVYKLKTNPT